jgi:hypothetical protein
MTNHRTAKHNILNLLGATLLGILASGCAGPAADAGRSVSASPTTGDFPLTGRWDGSFHGVAIGDKHLEGRATLEIADDGTFTLTETRPGGGTAKESGTVVVNGRRVTLETSTGASIMLDRKGEVLHGLAKDRATSYPVHITVQRQR